jgi:hypothetical protein
LLNAPLSAVLLASWAFAALRSLACDPDTQPTPIELGAWSRALRRCRGRSRVRSRHAARTDWIACVVRLRRGGIALRRSAGGWTRGGASLLGSLSARARSDRRMGCRALGRGGAGFRARQPRPRSAASLACVDRDVAAGAIGLLAWSPALPRSRDPDTQPTPIELVAWPRALPRSRARSRHASHTDWTACAVRPRRGAQWISFDCWLNHNPTGSGTGANLIPRLRGRTSQKIDACSQLDCRTRDEL